LTKALSTTLGKTPYLNYISGEWTESSSSETYLVRNPANTDDIVGVFQKSNREDVRKAIDAAQEAFDPWRDMTPPKRGAILYKAWSKMSERVEQFAVAMTREEGKTIRDSRGEAKACLNILEYFAADGRRILGETAPSELPNYFTYTIRKPLGVVAAISPWNFPLSEPVRKIAGAIVCGNTVIAKPATITPLSSIMFVQLLEEAGLPKGVVNLVTGPGSLIGEELATNQVVKGISFTGSSEVGLQLNRRAAEHLKKVQAEMGGKNPVVVMDDADLDLATEGIVQGAFGSTGQRCTCTSRVIVTPSIKDKLVEKVVERTKQFKVANGMREDADMGPLASSEQFEKVNEYIKIGRGEGARLTLGGNVLKGPEFDKGYFVEPTIFIDVKPEMRIAQEEIFGPVLAFMDANDFSEAVNVANGVQFGLAASIYCNDLSTCQKFVNKIDVGLVHINNPTVGGEAQLPFGGLKASGIGPHEFGLAAVEFFTDKITVFVDYSGRKREAKFI